MRRALNSPQNFFKHADKDHDRAYQFPDWELTGVRLVTTILNFNIVFQETTLAMNVFLAVYSALNPELLGDGNPLQEAVAAMPELKTLSREDMAATGYAVLKSTCPRLFDEPRFVGSTWLQP